MKLMKVVFFKFSSVAKQVLKMNTHFYRCCIEKQMLSHLVDIWLAACPFRRKRVCAKFYRPISIQSKTVLNVVFIIRFSKLTMITFEKKKKKKGVQSSFLGRNENVFFSSREFSLFLTTFRDILYSRKSSKHFHFREHLCHFLKFSLAGFRENRKTNIFVSTLLILCFNYWQSDWKDVVRMHDTKKGIWQSSYEPPSVCVSKELVI